MAETNKDLNHPWPKVPRYPDIQKIAREESTPPPAYRERNEIQDALNQVGGLSPTKASIENSSVGSTF